MFLHLINILAEGAVKNPTNYNEPRGISQYIFFFVSVFTSTFIFSREKYVANNIHFYGKIINN